MTTDGKFANGAQTAAFGYLFNDAQLRKIISGELLTRMVTYMVGLST